jgi:hypothetical protein
MSRKRKLKTFYRVTIDRGAREISVDRLTEGRLREEGEGREDFVNLVLDTISKGDIYDDSDPEGWVKGGIVVLYIPLEGAKVLVDGKVVG